MAKNDFTTQNRIPVINQYRIRRKAKLAQQEESTILKVKI
jgi:hypothetical protein